MAGKAYLIRFIGDENDAIAAQQCFSDYMVDGGGEDCVLDNLQICGINAEMIAHDDQSMTFQVNREGQ